MAARAQRASCALLLVAAQCCLQAAAQGGAPAMRPMPPAPRHRPTVHLELADNMKLPSEYSDVSKVWRRLQPTVAVRVNAMDAE